MNVTVVAEKPSVGRDIARALGATEKKNGYYRGGGYVVTWGIGHLVELGQPADIRPEWKRWRREQLPMLPDRWPLVAISKTKKQLGIVKKLMNARDCRYVVAATDAGREGELIFRRIYELVGCKKPFKRLWISSLTKQAITRGFRELREGAEFDALGDAARGRARADWLVGMNLSRAYSLAHDDNLSVGRVQTPTLAMIVERECAIRDFVPEDYYEVRATFEATRYPPGTGSGGPETRYDGVWFRPPAAGEAGSRKKGDDGKAGDKKGGEKTPDTRLPGDGEEAKRIAARVRSGSAQVESAREERKKQAPPLLYDLTELQRDANRLFGWTAKRTLEVAQALYEKRKLISYPRTDSRHLGKEEARSLDRVVSAIAAPYREQMAPGTGERPLSKRFVDDGKVTDHHAIIPTDKRPPAAGLPGDEGLLYDLVCRRLLMAWHDDYVTAVTRVVTAVTSRVGEEQFVDRFRSRGTVVLQPGWKALALTPKKRGRKKEEARLPTGLARGAPQDVVGARPEKKQTRPPKPFSEATLLTAMETAGKALDDRELSDAMRERGLGTPATRAAIIETLLRRAYVERSAKTLRATDKGIRLIELVHEQVRSPEMTGRWENELKRIERGDARLDGFMEGIERYVSDVVSAASNAPPAPKMSSPSIASKASRSRTSAASSGRGAARSRVATPTATSAPTGPRSGGYEAPPMPPMPPMSDMPPMPDYLDDGPPPDYYDAMPPPDDFYGGPPAEWEPAPSRPEPPRPSPQPSRQPTRQPAQPASRPSAAPPRVQVAQQGQLSFSEAPARPQPARTQPARPPVARREPGASLPEPVVVLRERFGFERFRPHQEDVCRSVAAGDDALLVMPTGAGKSLCYQLPGVMRGGTTLVICPLIALMEDQVAALQRQGFRAERIHSGRAREESREVCREFLRGNVEFLFIAPERLGVPGFPELLAKGPLTLLAVDEAHCISQWGHDFRPDYRMIRERLSGVVEVPTIALTATATVRVQEDIARQLGLASPRQFIHGFRRENIAVESLEVSPGERPDRVAELLADPKRRPAIVYAPTRKKTEELAEELASSFPAEAYHAGLPADRRDRAQARFLSGDLEVVVATIAFGMGIDKPNVRTVVHTALPSSVEGYYQEIGRAGRDGLPSRAVLMYSFVDRRTHEHFLERDYPDAAVVAKVHRALDKRPRTRDELAQMTGLDEDVVENALDKLWVHGGASVTPEETATRGTTDWRPGYEAQRSNRQDQIDRMARLAQTATCRMLQLVGHFGDRTDSGEPCGVCDVCNAGGALAQQFREPTRGERTMLRAIVEELKMGDGVATGRLFRETVEGVTDRRTFERLMAGLARANVVGYEEASFEKGGRVIPFRRANLLGDAEDTRTGELLNRVKLAEDTRARKTTRKTKTTRKSAGGARKGRSAPADRVALAAQADPALVEAMKEWRLGLARQRRVPAFRILTDKVLLAIVAARPSNKTELLCVTGVGPTLAEKYGAQWLRILKK